MSRREYYAVHNFSGHMDMELLKIVKCIVLSMKDSKANMSGIFIAEMCLYELTKNNICPILLIMAVGKAKKVSVYYT